MKEKLRKRLPSLSEDEIDAIHNIIQKYNIEPTIRNLDSHGFLFTDLKGRTVRICMAKWRQKEIYISNPFADIVVVNLDGMIVGWIESSKIEDLEDRFVIKLASLSPLPEKFSFDQKCAHLEDHGGYCEDGQWICFNCGIGIIFNDKK